MKRILITGVAGFIGSNLLGALLQKGYEVVGIDNLSQGFVRNIEPFLDNKHFSFFQGDVRDIGLMSNISKGVDCIVHLAAYKIPRYGNAIDTLMINTKGTENALQVALDNKCKILIASTSDVYGKNPNVPFNEESDMVLGKSEIRRWSYAVSKIFDEHLCFAYKEKYDLKITILRYFGSYGINQNLSWWGGPQSVFINSALNNEPMTIHGDGLQTRSFTYVSDTVDGTIRAIEKDEADGNVFNIGCTEEITILDLAYKIWKIIFDSEKPKIEFIPYESFGGGYEDVRRRIPDIEKAKKLLGFEPKVSLDEGLIKTISWQRNLVNS